MNFPRYTHHKKTGISWLRELPSHWNVDRLKWSVVNCMNGVWGDDPQGDENDVPCVRVADFDRTKLVVKPDTPTLRNVQPTQREGRVLRPGDLLIEKSGGGELRPVGCVVLYHNPEPAVCSNFVARMEVANGMVPSYWRYVHAAVYSTGLSLSSIKQNTGIQNLDQQQYLNEQAPFPPEEEQSAIAAFLDRETGKIDALVAEQEKLIALLKEKRQAVISHAVTKGLDPSVPMKDSGIEWLGKIPAHWNVLRIKNVVQRIEQGWSPEAIDQLATENEWGVLKSGCVNYGVFRDTEHKTLPAGVEPPEDLRVSIGDVLMSRASGSIDLIGSAALVTSCSYNLILSDKIFRLVADDTLCAKPFIVFAMGSSALRAQIAQAISGAEGLANNIGKGAIREFWLAVPPVLEQTTIVEWLHEQLKNIDALTEESTKATTLLKEHRAALISATVTGKIDVRGLVDTEASKGAPEAA